MIEQRTLLKTDNSNFASLWLYIIQTEEKCKKRYPITLHLKEKLALYYSKERVSYKKMDGMGTP